MLESRTFFRVGGDQPIKVDVRVVAATNRPLREAVALGEFRDDLYYRLNVLNIYLPPLRERREDIPLLVRRFIREFAKAHDRHVPGHRPRGDAAAGERALARQRPPAPQPDRVAWWCWRPARRSGRPTSRRTCSRARDAAPRPAGAGGAAGRAAASAAQELEFILRSLVELKLQVEELRRRMDDQPQRVQVIDLGDHAHGDDVLPESDKDGERPVVYRPGMTMAEVEKAAIEAAFGSTGGTAGGLPKF